MIRPRQPKADMSRRTKLRAVGTRLRGKGVRLPRMPYPHAQESMYAAELVRWTRARCVEIMRGLRPLLNEQFRQDESADSVIGRLRAQAAQAPLPRVAARFGRLEGEARAAANAQVAGVTGGIPLWTGQSHATQRVLRAAVSENVALITSIPDQLLTQVESVLTQGLADGAHRDDMVSRLKGRFGVAESRAELIARDQIGKVNGQLAEARARDLGMETYIWRITGGPGGDGRVRPMHAELEGTEQRYDQPPVTNEDGDENNPGEDYQCLPGDTQIAFPGAVDRAFRRFVRAELAVLVAHSGVILRATPNHPVLTLSGWKAAKDVHVGDHLIQIQPEMGHPAEIAVQHRMAEAAQLFDAMCLAGITGRARGAAAQFHNDGRIDQEVHVVDVDGGLFRNCVATLAQDGGQFGFPQSDEYGTWTGSALRDLEFMLTGLGGAADGTVRSPGDRKPLFAGTPPKAQEVGCGAATDRHTDLAQVCVKRGAADTDPVRNALERFASEVRRNHCWLIPVLVTATRSEGFGGLVFNFSTHAGWYSANGLVVHNCRCTAEPPAEALLEALLSAPEPDTSELDPSEQAQAGLADAELEYMREGMRDLAPVEAAYEGATAEEIEAIATGQSATKNSVSAFDPIKIESGPQASGRQFALIDGRHRLAAARNAGAKNILASVNGKRVVIPTPRL